MQSAQSARSTRSARSARRRTIVRRQSFRSVRRLSLADESGTDADEPPLFPVAQGSGSGDNDLAPLSETQDDSELSPGPTSDSGSDSSASGVTESELEPPDANREQVARPAAGTPATAYIPRHHWDTRYSAKVRRTTEYASAKARTHWSSFRTAVIGRKSPLGRLAAAVRGVLTPGGGAAADTPGSSHTGTPELATRLSFDKHGSPRAPESSPMVLTIQSTPQPAWRKCLLAARLPLVLVAALLFMGLLGWLLMGIAPGLKEQPLLSQRDRDAACAAGGVPYEMVTKMIEAAAARQREEQATVLGAYEKACADGIAAARRNATQLQAIVAALRQQHDGDWTAANQTVTIVRDTLIERTVVLNTEVTNLIARLDVVEVAAQGGSDGVTELRTSLEQLQKDVQALQAAVGDIPNTYPTFDWVKELVAKEVSAFLEDSTASTEAMRAGDQEALTKNLMKIGRDAQAALEAASGANAAVAELTPSVEHAASDAATAKAAAAAAGEDAAAAAKAAADAAAIAQDAAAAASKADAAFAAVAADGTATPDDVARALEQAQEALATAQGATKDAGEAKVVAQQALDAVDLAAQDVTAANDAAKDAKEAAQEALDKAEAALEQRAGLGDVSVGVAGGVSEATVRRIVAAAVDVRAADGVERPDYALASAGATVVYEPHLLSKTFEPTPTLAEKVLCFVGLVPHRGQSPQDVIDPDTHVGKCWPMAGSDGFVTVRLSHSGGVKPTHFTVDHAHKDIAHGRASAPRFMEAWGYRDEHDQAPVQLATFEYDKDSTATQTYERNMALDDETFFPLVQLRIKGNWGNPHHTCLYRFRVHGTPQYPPMEAK